MTRDNTRAKGAEARKETNGDRIRAMSNEELAELLIDVEDNEILGILYYAMDGNGYELFEDAKREMLDWLGREAED